MDHEARAVLFRDNIFLQRGKRDVVAEFFISIQAMPALGEHFDDEFRSAEELLIASFGSQATMTSG